MKIYIGNNNVGGLITDFKLCFAEMGIETITGTYGNPHPGDEGSLDYDFSKHKHYEFKNVRPTKLQLWLRDRFNMDGKIHRKALKECDVFIFIWDTFRYDYSDLEELKQKGKKIIFIFCGDDARWFYSQKQEFESYGLRSVEYDENYSYITLALDKKLQRLRKAEKFADIIYSRLDQAQIELRPYHRWNMMLMPERYAHFPEQREFNPVIAHAPTSRKVKGSSYVLDVFERLKKEGVTFTPLVIEKVKNEEALKMYGSADIVIDQLIIPGTGKLASEAMVLGKVVLGHMAYNSYPQKNPSDCPIIDVNPDTLYDKLKEIIANYKLRCELAARGRVYVKKYLDTRFFAQKTVALLKGEKIEYDYVPDFFRNKFVPESEEAKQVYNKWNRYVENETWYKEYISKGERSGLVF